MTLSAVLDTNVVLDWFVFGNAGVGPLAQAIESGTVLWIGCSAMQDELAHVLLHAHLAGRPVDRELVLTSFRSLVRLSSLPSALPTLRLRCTDPSDQMFIDLALVERARWLVTRDRALLKLRRRAAAQGLLVVTPEQWQAEP
jgi:putative PIN family toxin of toxin-antitoxin system